MKTKTAFRLVEDELERATKEFGNFNSPHEGYAVMLEEVEELWDEIKASKGTNDRILTEAVQVAAMAVRFLVDLGDEKDITKHEIKIQKHKTNYDSYGGYSG